MISTIQYHKQHMVLIIMIKKISNDYVLLRLLTPLKKTYKNKTNLKIIK
jgi:hypothetical protein